MLYMDHEVSPPKNSPVRNFEPNRFSKMRDSRRLLPGMVHGGVTRSVDTFHNCRKPWKTEGERSKIIILRRSTTEMTRECCKTDLLDTSRRHVLNF